MHRHPYFGAARFPRTSLKFPFLSWQAFILEIRLSPMFPFGSSPFFSISAKCASTRPKKQLFQCLLFHGRGHLRAMHQFLGTSLTIQAAGMAGSSLYSSAWAEGNTVRAMGMQYNLTYS